MNDIMQTMSFNEFKLAYEDVIPNWLKSLPDDVVVTEVELSPNRLLGNQNGVSAELFQQSCPSSAHPQHNLYIVTAGRVEIYDLMPTDLGVLTFRPIRILRAGDVFGEFSILDSLYPQESATPAILGETWHIVSGYACSLPCSSGQEPMSQLNKIIHDDSLCADGAALCFYANKWFPTPQPLTSTEVTKFARLELPETCVGMPDVLSGLYNIGWKRVRSYRDSLNSFNWRKLIQFREHAYTIAGTDFPQKKILIYAIADAILDALNRPLRNEPCFTLPNGQGALHAADCKLGPFCFPIDSHNYFIALGLHHAGLRARADILGTGKQSRGRNNGWNEQEQFFPPNMNDELEKKVFPSKGGPFPEFYTELVMKLLQFFKESNQKYPYTVEPDQVDGARRRMLLLKFTPQ